MLIKDKWKKFAIDHHFSHDPTLTQSVELFDRLLMCDTQKDVEAVLEEMSAYTWEPYSEMASRELAESVEAMARVAQNVESSE